MLQRNSNVLDQNNKLTAQATMQVLDTDTRDLKTSRRANRSASKSSVRQARSTSLSSTYDIEPNNTRSSPSYLGNLSNANRTFTGRVSTTDDKDYYYFKVDNQMNNVSINLSPKDYTAPNQANADIRLLRPDGSEIARSASDSSWDSISRKGLAAGYYTIEVDRYNGGTAVDYNLSVTGSPTQRKVSVGISAVADSDKDVENNLIQKTGDFYSKVRINNGYEYTSSTKNNAPSYFLTPDWNFSQTVSQGTSFVPISINLWDDDGVYDDHVDINADPNQRSLSLVLNTATGKISGGGLSREYNVGEIIRSEGTSSQDAAIAFVVNQQWVL